MAATRQSRCTATSRPGRHRPRWLPNESRGEDRTMTEQRSPGHRHRATAVSGEEFAAAWKRNAAKLSRPGLYHPDAEPDGCGVGLADQLEGTPQPDWGCAGQLGREAM